jgi:hypothetical protein
MDQLDRSIDGGAWHGPSVNELLKSVTVRQAAATPIPGAHSIWEIVLHISVWQDVARRRIAGEVIVDLPPELDWPAIPDTSEAAWLQAVENVPQSKQKLRETISQISEERLEEILPAKGYSIYFLLHGVIQHNLYHAGQIAVLKKLTAP